MSFRFSGSRALIVGGSCQMGLALAQTLSAWGITPVSTYRNDAGRRRIEDRLGKLSKPFETVCLDLTADEPCMYLDRHLQSGVDYLIDFAQGDLEGLVASADPQAVKLFFMANIIARTEVIQRAARKMLSTRKGRMVYISSAASAGANPGQGFYTAAKQAAEALYRSIGLEMAGRGITTVTLRPGYVAAGRGRRYIQANQGAVADKVPLGRALNVQEVVETIAFLLSDSAVGINATEVTMDGGMTAGK